LPIIGAAFTPTPLFGVDPMNPLKDPVPAYNGASHVEVHLLQNFLDEAGIEAYVPEETTNSWDGGLIPAVQTPQVFIEREDVERAKPILEEYERHIAERKAAEEASAKKGPIKITCEECHKEATFPYAQLGTVQVCPSCGAYVDVTLDDTPDEQRVMTMDT